MKIDIFCHIFPKSFSDRMLAMSERAAYMQKRVREIPVMTDLEQRFRIMDQFPGYQQVFCLASPPLEAIGDSKSSPELARIANDGMAELVAKHPDRFPGFVASLPLNNMDACMKELDRAIQQLGARGVQIFSNVNGRPLDEPEFRPLFERMAAHDLPIWMHPSRPATFADYPVEKKSKFEMWWVFGWPYETSIAMARIAFTGIFDAFPNLKIITHHTGGMAPYFEGRIGPGLDQLGVRTPEEDGDLVKHNLKRRPLDYFRMFYGDTALFGAVAPLECGVSFFGLDHILFATDMPFDPEKGPGFIRETIRAIEAMSIAPADRAKIYEGNARKLLKLD
ncbi:MAG: amidohydrolase [Acidobacteria bacterium RIFCSPLOWO2_02_FULL_61_28]|nr:MAG: amidohydrolase [Acidobacteria bacterium RIFCSPLOWO2_02_FULL_61_28]